MEHALSRGDAPGYGDYGRWPIGALVTFTFHTASHSPEGLRPTASIREDVNGETIWDSCAGFRSILEWI